MIDYFAANLWQLWTLVVVVCLILELTSGDFFILCFSIGALATAVVSAIGVGFYGQLAVLAIDGDDWKAVSADGSYVPSGQNVKVVGRESIIITVEKV